MAQRVKLKYKNIAAALAVFLLLVLALPSACSHSSSNTQEAESSVVDLSSKEDVLDLTKNYKYVSVKNSEALSSGMLALVNAEHPYKGTEPQDMDGVYGYLFNDDGDQIMQASSTRVTGSKHLLIAFNSMISEFYKKTQIGNIVINTIYSAGKDTDEGEGQVTIDSPEHSTGFAIDLSTYNDEDGSYPVFEASANYKWIGENCWKYGFVQRYTEDKKSVTGVEALTGHYRYVGQLNAEIMSKNSYCLEEYIDYIKKYSFEKPLEYTSDNGNEYVLYYVDAGNDKKVNLPVPLDENNEEYKYGYSGDNVGGYIVWVKMYEAEDYTSKVEPIKKNSDSTVDSEQAQIDGTGDASAQADEVVETAESTVDEQAEAETQTAERIQETATE